MSQPMDWQRHAALLDMQPSNRRLVQQSRTPRSLRDAGWTGLGNESVELRIDTWLCWMGWIATPFVLYQLYTRLF